MNCTILTDKLDDYLDGLVDEAAAATLTAHVGNCETCRGLLAKEQLLRESLQDYADYGVPHPDAAFFDRALLHAAHSGMRRQRNRWIMTGVGGTIAAGLVLWILGGLFVASPDLAEAPVPAVVMTLEEPRTINLVFSSATALADATMTVVLPQGIEVAGYAGRGELTWMTELTAGKNVLPLKLVATSLQGGELMARLRHAGEEKSFRIRVTVI